MTGAIKKATELVKEGQGTYMLQQFNNPANPAVHFRTTGPEIWEATEGRIDILVAGLSLSIFPDLLLSFSRWPVQRCKTAFLNC